MNKQVKKVSQVKEKQVKKENLGNCNLNLIWRLCWPKMSGLIAIIAGGNMVQNSAETNLMYNVGGIAWVVGLIGMCATVIASEDLYEKYVRGVATNSDKKWLFFLSSKKRVKKLQRRNADLVRKLELNEATDKEIKILRKFYTEKELENLIDVAYDRTSDQLFEKYDLDMMALTKAQKMQAKAYQDIERVSQIISKSWKANWLYKSA